MAHTNQTANYELSQFVANDKPTFLGDYNGDMAKIDAAIKAADNKAGAADTTAESAAALATSASTTATEAATDAATAAATATTALNTANNATTTAQNASTAAQSASTTASAAATKADAAKTEAEAATAAVALKPSYSETFARMFGMTSEALAPVMETGYTITTNTLRMATNTDKSLAKFYGRLVVSLSAAASFSYAKIAKIASGFPTHDSDYEIVGLENYAYVNSSWSVGRDSKLVVKANGDVELHCTVPAGATEISAYLPPCLYVMEDFGD